MKISLLIILVMFSTSLLAAPIVAKVTRVKGQVSILELGKREATFLKEGASITEGSSILTKEGSFVIIAFNDGHQMTVTPNSKVVIDSVKKKSPDVVGLIIGKIRTSVKPDENKDKEKFIIKTRTASLGVRGTEFQVGFNLENKVTSLLTFTGNVAIKPTDSKEEKVIEVKKGEFASTQGEKMNNPVAISPKQFTLLKMNDIPEEKKEISKEDLNKEMGKAQKEFEKITANEDKPKSNLLPGGYIDSKTGLYIPPTEKKEVVGTLDLKGDYVAPQGLELDPVKGFVVQNKKGSEQEETVKKLNEEIQKQIPLTVKKSSLEEDKVDLYKKYYKE